MSDYATEVLQVEHDRIQLRLDEIAAEIAKLQDEQAELQGNIGSVLSVASVARLAVAQTPAQLPPQAHVQ